MTKAFVGKGKTLNRKHYENKSNAVFTPLALQSVPMQPKMNLQCYPNPFRDYTNIQYQLTHTEKINITILNIMGQPVKKLVNRKEPPGKHAVIWRGSDYGGDRVLPGLYLIRLQTDNHLHTQWVRLYN